MSDFVKIRIGSEFEGRGFEQANAELKKLTTAGADFVNVLKAGVGIDLGGRLVQSLAAVPQILQEAIANGVRFNATMETATLGIAAVIKQFDATGKTSFDQALGKSAEAIALLKAKADATPATFEQLLGGFQATAAAAAGANISLKEHVELTSLMAQALGALGIRSEQLVQESRALMTGNITEDAAAARMLGITKAQIDAAKEQGQLYEFLTGKLSAFAEAGDRGASTLNVALSTLEDRITSLSAEVSKPIFEALKEGVLALNSELAKPETVEALKALGFEIAEIAKAGLAMIRWAVDNAAALSAVAHAAGVLGVALAAMKISQITIALGAWAVSLLTSGTALDAETAALARNTAAQAANAVARGGGAAGRAASTAMTVFGDALQFSRAGFGARAGADAATATKLAMMEAEARRMGKLSTHFDAFGTTTNRGAWMTNAGSSKAALGQAGVGAATAAPLAGLAELGVACLAAGAAIGSWIDGVKKASVAAQRAEDKKDFMGGDAETRMQGLRDAAAGVNRLNRGDTEAAIRRQIITEEAGAANLDGTRRANAETRLGLLREMLAGLSETQALNDALLDTDEKRADAAEAQARAYEAAAAKLESSTWVAGQSTANAATAERLGAASEDPDVRLAMMKAAAMRQRIDLANAHELSPGADILGGSAESMVPFAQSDAGRARLKALAELQRKITDEEKKQGEAIEENMAAEAKRFTTAQEIGQAREAAIEGIREEHAIQRALIDGADQAAESLQRQKKLREDIAALIAAGVPKAQAEAEAQITADLDAQAKARQHEKEGAAAAHGRAQIEADMAVDAAGTHRGKKGLRDAQEAALRLRKNKEFGAAGYEGEELDRMVESAVDIHRRQNRGGRIGGATVRSGRDTLGGGIDNLAGLGSGSTALTGGKGLTADADWNKLFQNGISPLVPRGGMAPGGKPGEGGIDKAAAAAEGAEKSLKDGTGKMSKALDAMKTTAGTTFEQMTATLNEVKGQFQTMQTSLKDLQTQLDNIG